jgi:hypothetical protein
MKCDCNLNYGNKDLQGSHDIDCNVRKNHNWQSLQAFYRLKSYLLPGFIERNKRCLNLLEDLLMQEYQKGGEQK